MKRTEYNDNKIELETCVSSNIGNNDDNDDTNKLAFVKKQIELKEYEIAWKEKQFKMELELKEKYVRIMN
jgi:hypothetical protein